MPGPPLTEFLAPYAAGLPLLAHALWLWAFWRLRRLRYSRFLFPEMVPAHGGASTPPVDIVVAARDEEEIVETALRSLLAQDHADRRVILVDDRSSDNTRALAGALAASDPALTVVDGQPAPEGWFGKPWALWQGVARCRPEAEWLLFTDADVIHAPGTLTAALAYARAEELDILSLVPKVETHFFWEHVLYPVLPLYVGARWKLDEINNPDSDAGLAAGGFILIRRGAYDRLGGHDAVRGAIVEDVMIARRAKQMRIPIRTLLAPHLLHTRMYKDAAELWEGLRRHACETLHRRWSVYVGSLAWTALALGLPMAALVLAMAGLRNLAGPVPGGSLPLIAAALALAWPCVFHAIGGRASSTPLRYCLLAPLGLVVYQILSGLSMGDVHLKKEIRWKGRANRVTRS